MQKIAKNLKKAHKNRKIFQKMSKNANFHLAYTAQTTHFNPPIFIFNSKSTIVQKKNTPKFPIFQKFKIFKIRNLSAVGGYWFELWDFVRNFEKGQDTQLHVCRGVFC